MSESNNILSSAPGQNEHNRLSEDKLLLYLEGKLTAEEQHEVEQWLADEGLESDAVEGLQQLSPADTRNAVNRLNHGLRKRLRRPRKKRSPLRTEFPTWVAIMVILLLTIIAYIVFRKSV